MKNSVDKEIPNTIKDFTSWQISRRRFIKNAIAAGTLSQIPLLESCTDGYPNKNLSEKKINILISVQNILFPRDEHGPGAIDFNADKYLLWVLSDKRIADDDKQYVVDGIRWLNESAQETYSKKYLKLTKKDQVELIQKVSKTNWGESWLSVLLTYIFEAMISDPIYGFNKEEIGWKWLEHKPGYPRPSELLMYDEIFSKKLNI